jgi:hypothetical protein
VIHDSLTKIETFKNAKLEPKKESVNEGGVEVNNKEESFDNILDDSDEDLNDELYKSPENLVYETKILTSKSS